MKDGDSGYSGIFEISLKHMKEIQFGFEAVEISSETYIGKKVYKTKNECIDEMIKSLQELKDV